MRSLRVAIYQCRAGFIEPAERLRELGRTLDGLADAQVDVLVCPELFMTGYETGPRVADLAEPADGPFARGVAELARRCGTAVLYGFPERGDGHLFNAASCYAASGERVAHHRKLQLAPELERGFFEAGSGLTLFDLGDWRIAVLVCYDVEFPELVRACALGGATLVLAPTALRRHWHFVSRTLIPARAFENGLYLAYANYAGEAGGWDYLGESFVAGPDGSEVRGGDTETVVVAQLDPERVTRARNTLSYLVDRRTDFPPGGSRGPGAGG